MRYIPAALFLALVALVAAFLASRPASSEQLLVNPGFEDGLNGWTSIDAEISASLQARTGSGALLLTSSEFESSPDVFQWVDVQAASVYVFSGWLLMDDPEISHAFLRIIWFDALHNQLLVDDSGWLVGRSDSYRKITMTPRTAPPGAVRARVAAVAIAEGAMSMLLDDFAFDRVSAPTPTASPLPTPTEPPTPAPETETPAATASASPLPTPTVVPTQSPGPVTTGPKPSPTWTPAPQTATPRPTPPEPLVFPSIANAGFEQVSGDAAAPYGWRKIGGEISSVFEPVRSGQRAIALRSESTSTKWIYQTVSVSGAQFYQFSAWAYKNDPAVTALFLRISWYESDDGSGEALSTVDSLALLETDSREFHKLDTGPVQAPASARTARLRLMLRPAGSGPGQGYFDDAEFLPAPAPTPTGTPAATSSPGAPTATPPQSAEPTATAPPPATTPAPTLSAAPETLSPEPTPTPSAAPEPDVFPLLVNGGFEEARDDGTPYGWHKNGGTFAVGTTAVAGGEQSLEFYSATAATKWVYQSVSVTGNAYYRASAWALDDSPAIGEVLMRISWYASEDGSGQALSSDDSAGLTGDSADYRHLDTGPIRAPPGAQSARVRLLVRPVSSAAAVAYFDDVAFGPVEAPSPARDGEPSPSASASRTSATGPPPVVGGVSVTPYTGQIRSPIALANVKPAQADAAPALADAGGELRLLEDIALALVIGIPAVGLAAMFSYDLSRPRRTR